ncbi:ABC transporter ATP-binding protein [uncultured Methylobacterium sp.]|uniref:ABC transporter ATP-binding protein n=1 Tax=uncultured Methylobacterium sp. TaxID=157278 RepID=UPI0035C96EC4
MLRIEGLTVGFEGADPALADVTLALAPGEALLACGAGASGKSVLLAAASGVIPRLVRPAVFAGRVSLGGRALAGIPSAELFSLVGPVLQNLDDQLWNLGVEDLIAFSLENRRMERAEIRRRIAGTLDLFGLDALRGRMVLDLSGGERRMVALAAATAHAPRLLVLDEPTTGLDPDARARLVAVLRGLRAAPDAPTILAADQDAAALAPAMDRLALLRAGRLTGDLPVRDALVRTRLWEEAGVLAPGRRKAARAAPAPGPVLLEVSGLQVSSQRAGLRRASGAPVLADVGFTLRAGEVAALVGPNGAGKTTLFRAVLGLAQRAAGRIAIEGEDAGAWTPARRARRIGYLPQTMRRVLFHLSAIDEAAFAIAVDARGMKDAAVRTRARAALDRYGLAAKAEANPFALSAREQALLGLACLDAAGCRVAILDEPLLARDAAGRAALERFLTGLRATGGAAILISHDLELVDDVSDRLMILERGRLGFDGPIAEGWRSGAFARLGWPRPYAGLDRAA